MVPTQSVAGTATAGATTMPITVAQPALVCSLTLKFGIGNVGSQTISSIAQTNVTWARQQQFITASQIIEEWLGTPSGGTPGTTITATFTGAITPSCFAVVSEWPAVLTKDNSNTNNGVSNNPATGTITPTSGESALISAWLKTTGTYLSGPTNGWTADISSGSSNVRGAYLSVLGTTGAYSTDWTWTGSVTWDVIYVVYKVATNITTKKGASNIGTKLGTRQPWMR